MSDDTKDIVTISKSVGRGGANASHDVMTVQVLLNKWIMLRLIPGIDPLGIDGVSGPKTKRAIGAFQLRYVDVAKPDMRVAPGRNTIKHLNLQPNLKPKTPLAVYNDWLNDPYWKRHWETDVNVPEWTRDLLDIILEFELRDTKAAFTKLNRSQIANGLRDRLEFPYHINQGELGLCTSANFVYTLVRNRPRVYVTAVIDLYENGSARIGGLSLNPNSDLKQYEPKLGTAHVDWIIMASLRDSENWFLDITNEEKTLVANSGNMLELTRWCSQVGYTVIKKDYNTFRNASRENLFKAGEYRSMGFTVILSVNAARLQGMDPKIEKPDHVATLMSVVNSSTISFDVFTWGKKYRVPQTGTLNIDEFLEGYYGYIACRF